MFRLRDSFILPLRICLTFSMRCWVAQLGGPNERMKNERGRMNYKTDFFFRAEFTAGRTQLRSWYDASERKIGPHPREHIIPVGDWYLFDRLLDAIVNATRKYFAALFSNLHKNK